MDPTVEGFARGEWLDERKISKPFAWKDDLSRLVHHFLPTFGKRRLTWLDTDEGARAIRTWAIELRSHKAQRDGKPLAPRSVWNVYSVAKVLLDDAVDLRRLERNPLASFRTDKHLPHKSDKLDGWRERVRARPGRRAHHRWSSPAASARVEHARLHGRRRPHRRDREPALARLDRIAQERARSADRRNVVQHARRGGGVDQDGSEEADSSSARRSFAIGARPVGAGWWAASPRPRT